MIGRAKLGAALRQLPYGSLVGSPPPPACGFLSEEEYMECVAGWLEKLSDIQRQQAMKTADALAQLLEMHQMREAVRDFFGVSA